MTHLLRYLLIYGERKKKVELSVQRDVDSVEVETLRARARELFGLKGVILQIWDKGFEDWVDLDDGDPTPTNSRIRVEPCKDTGGGIPEGLPLVLGQGSSEPPATIIEESRHRLSASSEAPVPCDIQISSVSYNPGYAVPEAGSGGVSIAAMLSERAVPASILEQRLQNRPSHQQTSPHRIPSQPRQVRRVPSQVPAQSKLDVELTRRQDMQSKTVASAVLPTASHTQFSPIQQVHSAAFTTDFTGRPVTSEHVPETSYSPRSRTRQQQEQQQEEQLHVITDSAQDIISNSNSSSLETTTTQSQDAPCSSGMATSQAPPLSRLVRYDDKQWIFRYKLPEFPAHIVSKLQEGFGVSYRDRSLILECIYESVIPYTYYPTTSDYTQLTRLLLERFPCLYVHTGHIREGDSKWEAWKHKIMHKFKNHRKRKDNNIPVVQLHKRARYLTPTALEAGYPETTKRHINLPEQVELIVDDNDDEYSDGIEEIEEITIKEEYSGAECDEPGRGGGEFHVMPADTTDFGRT